MRLAADRVLATIGEGGGEDEQERLLQAARIKLQHLTTENQ